MHFRILKTIATGGFLTALECTKFVSARTPLRWGAYSAPYSLLQGPTSMGRKEGGREGKEMEGT